MNKKHFLWRLFAAAFAAVLTFGLGACSDDDTEDGDFQLYYPEMVNFGPSMSYAGITPSYVGGTPSAFTLSAVTFDGSPAENDYFTINESSGAISIADTEDMNPGVYRVSVSCFANGHAHNFADVFVLTVLPAVPVDLTVSAEEVEIPYDGILESDTTVQLTPEGEFVSITGYALLQEEGKEYFAVTSEGEISVNTGFKGEFLPGIYPLTVQVSTYAGDAVFEDLVTVKITSPALELVYTPAEGRMESLMGFQSAAPAMKGSPEEVVYSLKGVTPETDGIDIDPETGVLSVAKDVDLAVGTKYAVDVTVTNRYGAADFDAAFTLEVIGYIAPIEESTFAYADAEMIQGTSFTAEKAAGFVGDEVTFSLGELPAALEGRIAIDGQTGAVSAANGNDIPLGDYTIPVLATNSKSEASATLKLSVIENPYYFTYVSYGNNLDLPALENASQFWCQTEKEYLALDLTPTTDAKPGTEIEYSLEVIYRESEADTKYKGGQGSTIDPVTGVITPDGFKYNDNKAKGALLYVTATAGKGKVGETVVKTPVFFLFASATTGSAYPGIMLEYKPFVFQVNPRKGGVSAAPIITGVDDPTDAGFMVDYRRDFQFFSLGGYENQQSGFPADAGSFMNYLWTKYNEGLTSGMANTGSKHPMSYYFNTDIEPKQGYSSTVNALAYVRPEDKAVVVNPNKWIDSDGIGANGAMMGEMTLCTGNDPYVTTTLNGGAATSPIWIWFDEKF